MQLQNNSKRPFNLEAGTCNPGAIMVCTTKEAMLLVSQGMADIVKDEERPKPLQLDRPLEQPKKPTPKKVASKKARPKAATNG